jgi:hypothetical protein
MKALLTYASYPTREWDIDENFNPEIVEVNTIEEVLNIQEKHDVIIKKSFGKFKDYCDVIIEVYDDYVE